MTSKAFSSLLFYGVPTLLVGMAFAAAGTWAAIAQPPALDDTESPVGRRAAAQYKLSVTPLNLTEVAPPVSRHEAERFRQTQRAYIESPLILNAALAQPGVAALSVFRNSTDKDDWLKEHLLVTFPGDGDIMEIAVADAKAPKEDLVALANAISKAYFDEVIFREQGERTLPLQILRMSLQSLSSQVRDKIETLRQLEKDHGFDAVGTARRQWLTDEAWLLRQRIEELQAQHFDEKLRRLRTNPDSQEDASAKEAKSESAAIDELFVDEEERLKAQLDEVQATATCAALISSTDLDLRREEIELLREMGKDVARRVQLLQIESQAPNRVNAIGSKGSGGAVIEFYD